MSADTINVSEAIEPALWLYGNSALSSCMRMRSIGGALHVVADRPVVTFSSGERILWAALEVLARGEELTVEEAANAGFNLDTHNLLALHTASALAKAAAA